MPLWYFVDLRNTQNKSKATWLTHLPTPRQSYLGCQSKWGKASEHNLFDWLCKKHLFLSRYTLPKTPSFIPGQRCPENLEISIITDVHFSNLDYSEMAEDINNFFHIMKIWYSELHMALVLCPNLNSSSNDIPCWVKLVNFQHFLAFLKNAWLWKAVVSKLLNLQ